MLSGCLGLPAVALSVTATLFSKTKKLSQKQNLTGDFEFQVVTIFFYSLSKHWQKPLAIINFLMSIPTTDYKASRLKCVSKDGCQLCSARTGKRLWCQVDTTDKSPPKKSGHFEKLPWPRDQAASKLSPHLNTCTEFQTPLGLPHSPFKPILSNAYYYAWPPCTP